MAERNDQEKMSEERGQDIADKGAEVSRENMINQGGRDENEGRGQEFQENKGEIGGKATEGDLEE